MMNLTLNINIMLDMTVLLTSVKCDVYSTNMEDTNSQEIQTVENVANFFLCVSTFADEEVEQITNMKLQKLVYYAQGYHLAYYGKPLFNEDICAWKHGPVCPPLYLKYKDYGSAPIKPPADFDFDIFTPDQRQVLIDVWEYYSQFSATGLRNLTHKELPWTQTEQSKVIDLDLMQSYFSKMLKNDAI